MLWSPTAHSANTTDEYLFHQLIPYIGNKRKLLGLIGRALDAAALNPTTQTFVDLFAGTGVVSRFARKQGLPVLANDWEPYSEIINRCYLELSAPPVFFQNKSYGEILDLLNALPPRTDWVTDHLCPHDDDAYDIQRDRMFYMRKNGQRIDAIRHQISVWDQAGDLSPHQKASLLAPLLYQACYNANTSGVFKGFHKGWGGQTGTALYRIKGDLALRPATFFDNGRASRVTRSDAGMLAAEVPQDAFVYLDPPYNQHPYGANYHVLNSIALWDKPELSPHISGRGDKSAIRTDWRTQRRSAYNYAAEATSAYTALLQQLKNRAAWVATSYSTDGTIPLHALIEANSSVGAPQIFTQPYKRYRVSSQRFSAKPMTTEFIILTQMGQKPSQSVDALAQTILEQDVPTLANKGRP